MSFLEPLIRLYLLVELSVLFTESNVRMHPSFVRLKKKISDFISMSSCFFLLMSLTFPFCYIGPISGKANTHLQLYNKPLFLRLTNILFHLLMAGVGENTPDDDMSPYY
jgi:hypothetical protein